MRCSKHCSTGDGDFAVALPDNETAIGQQKQSSGKVPIAVPKQDGEVGQIPTLVRNRR